MKRFKIVFVSLILGVGLLGCHKDRDQARNDNPPPTATTPGSVVTSSSDLENAVKAKFQSDDQLRTVGINVSADADKKEVTLSGTVASQDLRSRAVDLAKSAQDGLTVNDKINVKPAA